MKNRHDTHTHEQGFSLIELMIVIAIIGILIGVGVPAYKAVVRQGNEAATIQSLKNLRVVEANYAFSHKGEYANFDQLISSGSFDDDRYKGDSPVVNGYVYTLKVTQKSTNQPAFFSINADPQQGEGLTATGYRHFYIDSSVGNVRENPDKPASATDPNIGQ